MTTDPCTRSRRHQIVDMGTPSRTMHRVPPRVTALARAAFAWRVIELRLDEILGATETPPRR